MLKDYVDDSKNNCYTYLLQSQGINNNWAWKIEIILSVIYVILQKKFDEYTVCLPVYLFGGLLKNYSEKTKTDLYDSLYRYIYGTYVTWCYEHSS